MLPWRETFLVDDSEKSDGEAEEEEKNKKKACVRVATAVGVSSEVWYHG